MSSTLIFQGVYFWLQYLQIWHASDSPDFRNGLTNYRFSIFKSNLMPGNPRVYCGLHPLLLYTRIEKSIEPLQKKLEDTNSKKWRVSPCKAMPRWPRGQVSLLEWSIVVLRPKRELLQPPGKRRLNVKSIEPLLHPLLLYTRIEKSIEPLQKKLEDTNNKKWRVSPCKAMPRGPRG